MKWLFDFFYVLNQLRIRKQDGLLYQPIVYVCGERLNILENTILQIFGFHIIYIEEI